ncbi:hypothetical protein HerbRD11066_27520 [Herbidospora sp. RD11066]
MGTVVDAPDVTAGGVFVGAACSAVAQALSSSAKGNMSLAVFTASPPVDEPVPFSDTRSDQGHPYRLPAGEDETPSGWAPDGVSDGRTG